MINPNHLEQARKGMLNTLDEFKQVYIQTNDQNSTPAHPLLLPTNLPRLAPPNKTVI